MNSSASDRRRASNARAQRAYRAKQKERLQKLESLVTASFIQNNNATQSSDSRDSAKLNTSNPPPTIHCPSHSVSHTLGNTEVAPFTSLFQYLTLAEAETCVAIVDREIFGLRDVVKYGLISLGLAMDLIVYETARTLPSRPWLELAGAASGDESIDMRLVFWAGLKLLSSLSLPPSAAVTPPVVSLINRQPVPGVMTLPRIAVFAAMKANAEYLGIPAQQLLDYESISPFNQCPSSHTTLTTKPDLLPTATQLAIPHHPSFDLVPWPEFRDRAIWAIASDPPTVDEDELCVDILNDGLLCWGGGATSLHGRGQGAPWDGRSWEAAGWFLEKYAGLTGGTGGRMWRDSQWWRVVRGEEEVL